MASDELEGANRHNPGAVEFLGVHYPTVRGKEILTHNKLYHSYDDVPALHIPVELDGVVP